MMADKEKNHPLPVFKERYDFKCAECGHEMQAEPSLSMTAFGMNSGHGRCSKCGTFLRLKIMPDIRGGHMESEAFEKWLARTKETAKGD